MNMNELITNVTLTKVCNIKRFKGATDSKQVTLAVKYNGLTLGDIFMKALRSDVISWQNGPGRKGYDTLVDKSTVNVSAKAPGAVTVDSETALMAKLATMSLKERKSELDRLYELALGVSATIEEMTDEAPAMTVKKVEAETPEIATETE